MPPRKPAHTVLYRGLYYAYLDKERERVPLRTRDPAEAEQRLAELLQRERAARTAQEKATPLAALTVALLKQAASRNTSKTTYELERNLLRLVTWLEGIKVTTAPAVTSQVVDRYVSHRRDGEGGVSAARVNRELDSLRRLLRQAESLGEIPEGQAAKVVRKLREPRPAPHERGLSKGELDSFLAAVDPRYVPLFRSVLGCGLRDEEMRHLDAADVNRRALTVTVGPKPKGWCRCCPNGWASKGHRYRTIPISKSTADALLGYLDARGALNLDKKRVWLVIQTGCKAARVPEFSLHDLRKAWASHLFDTLGPTSLQRISQWLGHADVITTMRYLRITHVELPERERLPF